MKKFSSKEDDMIDRMLYDLDLSIRRRGRVMRRDLDKVQINFSYKSNMIVV